VVNYVYLAADGSLTATINNWDWVAANTPGGAYVQLGTFGTAGGIVTTPTSLKYYTGYGRDMHNGVVGLNDARQAVIGPANLGPSLVVSSSNPTAVSITNHAVGSTALLTAGDGDTAVVISSSAKGIGATAIKSLAYSDQSAVAIRADHTAGGHAIDAFANLDGTAIKGNATGEGGTGVAGRASGTNGFALIGTAVGAGDTGAWIQSTLGTGLIVSGYNVGGSPAIDVTSSFVRLSRSGPNIGVQWASPAPVTKHVGANDFIPSSFDIANGYSKVTVLGEANNVYWYKVGAGSEVLWATLHLPVGAIITSMQALIGNPTGGTVAVPFTMALYTCIYTASPNSIAPYVGSNSAVFYFTGSSIATLVYAWQSTGSLTIQVPPDGFMLLRMSLPIGITFYGARITYSYSEFAPIIG
jgi:hypothetical protein